MERVPWLTGADDRYLCRVQEFRESLRIIDQVRSDRLFLPAAAAAYPFSA